MTTIKTWFYRGLISGVVFGIAFVGAQVATNTTFAQLPTLSPGGTVNFLSNSLGMLFNVNSAGSRALFGPVFPMTTPPSSGSWTNLNCGTFDTTQGYPYLSSPRQGTSAMCLEYQTPPSTPYVCKALIYHDISGAPPGASGTAVLAGFGLFFGDNAGKFVTWQLDTNGSTPSIYTGRWTNATTQTTSYTLYAPSSTNAASLDMVFRNPNWIAAGDDGVNFNFYWSIDGIGTPGSSGHWKLFDTRARLDFLAADTRVGFLARADNDAVELAVPSWSCQ